MARYGAVLTRFEALGGYESERRAAATLQGLRLGGVDPATPVAAPSGGQKTRLGLAALLISEPDLLLLDEPTNHLDVEALAWLEDFVRGYPHAVLIVSHDREFLDRTVTRILYVDPDTRTVQSYAGNYSDFATAREQSASCRQLPGTSSRPISSRSSPISGVCKGRLRASNVAQSAVVMSTGVCRRKWPAWRKPVRTNWSATWPRRAR